jgi:lipopolysaccharide/colanic/teichoic acid biosynthesis glycosyltransferase
MEIDQSMRYQYPAPTPLAHYWEDEVIRVWGIRIGISKKTSHHLRYFLGELVFANIFLLFQVIQNQPLALGVRKQIARAVERIELGATIKRAIDIAGAIIGLLMAIPLLILVAVAVKIDSPGPVFYGQERVGQNRRRGDRRAVSLSGQYENRAGADRRRRVGYGRPFTIYKFRSMCHNAEASTGPTWARKNDNRITRVGRFIRAIRLDELPQLFNVLRGEMSLVGPRPERPCFVCDLNGQIKDYARRFDVKPGITGLAQVEHKYDECIEDVSKKITYDLKYIKNWSVVQDLKIILRTITVVLTARGM